MVTLPTHMFAQVLQSGIVPTPRTRILILGLEPVLQSTRARILEQAGFECYLGCDLFIPPVLLSSMFRVAVLCQSLGEVQACAIQESLRHLSPTTAVLRLAKWSLASDMCFEHRLLCPTPHELIAAVQKLCYATSDTVGA